MSVRPGHGGRFLTAEEKANRPKITAQLLLRVAGYLKPYWARLLVVFLAIGLSSVLHLLPAVLTGRIIDEGLIGQDLGMLVRLLLLSLGVMLAGNLIGVLETYLNTWIALRITYDMRNQLFSHLQKMSHQFFMTGKQGDILTRMTGDISGVQQIFSGTLAGILSNSLTLAAAMVMMLQKNTVMALVAIVLIPLFTLPTRRVGKTRWNLTREAQERQDEINDILGETLSVSGQLLVKLYNKEDWETERYQKANRKMTELNLKERMAGRWFRVALSTFSGIGPMLIYLVGGILMMRYNADLTVGDITVLVALLGRMYMPVNALLGIQVDWIRSMALFTRIFEYFDLPVDIKNKENAFVPEQVEGNLRFRSVDFHYEKARPILRGIDFSVQSGKTVAIVGPSGAGKSTLMHLIPRLYDPTDGAVEFDGVDLREWDLSFLREQIGIVTQDTYLFNGTIRENLLYAKATATEDELIDACKKANIYEFIREQEKGLDTLVGNRGLKLSGGEKQRLSIARVLLKNPVLLLFDEATSSLDSISEYLIQTAIEPLMRDRTSIVIAHRLSTILNADEILVLDDGSITERGTHDVLIQEDGVYAHLYRTQFLQEV
ncbi:MAG: ABC transporter ATP-binding protein [Peptoniphilaceae bacterium]|jgi:ATP-binding cassette subfamily B protein